MSFLRNRKAQSTLEYAILIAVVIGAVLIMQTYMKRGVQGRLRSASDDIGEQFSPGQNTSNFTTTTTRSATESSFGGARSTNIHSQSQSRTGSENIGDLASDPYLP